MEIAMDREYIKIPIPGEGLELIEQKERIKTCEEYQ